LNAFRYQALAPSKWSKSRGAHANDGARDREIGNASQPRPVVVLLPLTMRFRSATIDRIGRIAREQHDLHGASVTRQA